MAATLRYTSWRAVGRKRKGRQRSNRRGIMDSLNGGNNTHGTSRTKRTCPSHDHYPHGAGVRGSRGRIRALNKTPACLTACRGFLCPRSIYQGFLDSSPLKWPVLWPVRERPPNKSQKGKIPTAKLQGPISSGAPFGCGHFPCGQQPANYRFYCLF